MQKFQKRPSIIPKRGIFRSCLLLLNNIPGVNIYNIVWIVETIALFFFGLSWIVKADAFPFLSDTKG